MTTVSTLDAKEYLVFPKDSTDEVTLSKTEEFLKQVTQSAQVYSARDFNKKLMFWLVDVTSSQPSEIQENDGSSNSEAFKLSRRQTGSPGSDIAKEYLIFPKHDTDEVALSKTEDLIKQVSKPNEVYPYRNFNNRLMYRLATVTSSQPSDIQKNNGVRVTKENLIEDEEQAALPPTTTAAAQLSDLAPTKLKRELEYDTQISVVSELVTISQPSDLEDYVFERVPGIEGSKKTEFPVDRREFLQTPVFRGKHQSETEDSSPTSHSTCVASKATGLRYGSAKLATLVVVKIADLSLAEVTGIWNLVWQDIKNKGRQKKSVVVLASGSTNPVDPNNLSDERKEQRVGIENLLHHDVPVLVAAGNNAQKEFNGKLRADVDTAPAVYEAPDFPLIVMAPQMSLAREPKPLGEGPKLRSWGQVKTSRVKAKLLAG
ncbi:hypothetical protein H2201_008548 [Coniosporium apollinis]|uniref:Peptidase S8/S53 domain-containing protein n=1 Tax=Coniosporium apollinis TaxID=61459 RepID=A0ABQ9NHW1_9PEZI|nr:hypothetical protein H2201_008548 [Coniosporium apollinis]